MVTPRRNSQSKASQTRLVVSIALFAAALMSAFAFSVVANKSHPYWIAARNIAPGAQISNTDVVHIAASLGKSSELYIPGGVNPIGSIATRVISAGEFLNQQSLTDDSSKLTSEQVPISVRAVDIPMGIGVGDVINIYWVHDLKNSDLVPAPEMVLAGVFLRSIDRKGSNFGNDLAITVSIHTKQVVTLLKATTAGRLVVVRPNG